MKLGSILFAATAMVAFAQPAAAQPNPNADSLNGQLTLNAGFTNDPRVINVTAGGSIEASTVCGSSGAGYIAANPDFKLTYHPGSLPLIISVDSTADTTIAINGPDGRWYCNDDGPNGTNPSVTFAHPLEGRYDIFVGSFAANSPAPARLNISELHSR